MSKGSRHTHPYLCTFLILRIIKVCNPDVWWASIKSTKISAINRTINLINCHVSCFISKENTTERSYCCKEDRMNIFKKGTIFHEEFRGLSCQTPRENNRWKSEENPLIVVGGWPHLFFNGKWDCSNRKNHTRIIVISPHVNPMQKESGTVCLWRKGQDNRGISSSISGCRFHLF